MSRRSLAVLAAAAAVAATPGGLVAPHAGAAAVVDCRKPVGPLRVITSARNMSCRKAARDLRAYRGTTTRRFRTPGGFRCVQVSGVAVAGQWRCSRGVRAYRFDFVD